MLEDSSTAERHYWQIRWIISSLARHKSTAVAVVEGNTLKYLENLLRSPIATLHSEIVYILSALASHESTATAVLNMHLYDLLVTLWRYVSVICPYFQRFS
jgi:hypothetical protein